MINKTRLTNSLIDMVKIDSPSFEEKDYREYLIKYFQDRDFEIYADDAGSKFGGNSGNLLVHIKGDNKAEKICLAAHMDTVSPGRGIEPIIEDGIVKSKSNTILAGDDKAGIAVILEAIECIKENNLPHRDIYILFTVCEEVGMLGAKHFDISKLPCKNMVILDVPGPAGIIAVEAPARYAFKITFTGKTAHAGIEPEKGINAIYVASEAISNMKLGRLDDETTANIGRIEGGSQTNIVTDAVYFTAEVRSRSLEKIDAQAEHMEEVCKAAAEKFGGEVEIEVTKEYFPMKLDQNSFVFNLCIESFEKEGINPVLIKTGGGSDGNILAQAGYDCAVISMGMEKVHTVDEMVNIDDMYNTAKAVVNMISL